MTEIPCQHLNFHVYADCIRLADDNKPLRFMAEIKIECAECHEPFMFWGAPAGFRFDGPSLDISGQTLSLPMKPWDGTIAQGASYQLHDPST